MARVNAHASAHDVVQNHSEWFTSRTLARAVTLVLGLCAWAWLFSSNTNPIPQEHDLIETAHPSLMESPDHHVQVIAQDLPAH